MIQLICGSTQRSEPAQSTDPAKSENPAEIQNQVDKLIAEGKKAIALKQWEEGAAKYADALDLKWVTYHSSPCVTAHSSTGDN